jgi:hypothetical protein
MIDRLLFPHCESLTNEQLEARCVIVFRRQCPRPILLWSANRMNFPIEVSGLSSAHAVTYLTQEKFGMSTFFWACLLKLTEKILSFRYGPFRSRNSSFGWVWRIKQFIIRSSTHQISLTEISLRELFSNSYICPVTAPASFLHS